MTERFWYWVYSTAIKLGLIRFDQWVEDDFDGMKHVVIEPRWFWQKKRGDSL